MGSRAKKIKKNITNMKAQQNKESNTLAEQQKIAKIRQKVADFKSQQKYDEALSVIIEMFNEGKTNPEFLYETADIYYMAGDYNRSAIWVKKTLEFDVNHLSGQLLMAKLYAMQDKQKECFQMLESLLKGHEDISAGIHSEIDDLLLYFQADYDEADLAARYPLIDAFLRAAEVWKEPEHDDKQGVQQEISTNHEEAEAPLQDIETRAEAKDKTAEQVIDEIMREQISLMAKVESCLDAAMDYYQRKDFVKALLLLKQALLIDGTNELALKNTAMVLIDMGEKAGALEILSKLKEKDFMVLKQIAVLNR